MSGQHSIDYYYKHRAKLLPRQAEWRRSHPEYMREYGKAYRARKLRQAEVIERTLAAADRWEYVRRCDELRAETQARQ